MKLFITGATGFIGRALTVRLLGAGHVVRALARHGHARPPRALPPGAAAAHGSLTDDGFLAQELRDADAVIHLAGTVKAFSRRGFRAVNEDLTRGLAEACLRHGPQSQLFLHVSSQAAGGPCALAPGLREADRAAPVSQYGLSKFLGERAVLSLAAAGKRVAVIRPPMVYGEGDMAFAPLYRLMARGLLTTPGPSTQPFSIVHVDDLCAGLELALDALAQNRAEGVYHLSGPAPCTWTDYAAAFGQALNRTVRPLRVPLPLLCAAAWGNALLHGLGLPTSHLTPDKYREARQEGWLLCDHRARTELGHAPHVDLASGAARTVVWCRAEGLL